MIFECFLVPSLMFFIFFSSFHSFKQKCVFLWDITESNRVGVVDPSGVAGADPGFFLGGGALVSYLLQQQ